MISYISGKVIFQEEKYIILYNYGLGYKIFLSKKNILKAEKNRNISLFCFLEVKENSLNLFGFLSMEELKFFEMIEKIRGVGPKAALEISSIGSLKELKKRIIGKDETLLQGIPGIGKKKATAIMIELGEKVKKDAISKENGVLESLVNLGFPRQKTQKIISEIDFKGKTTEEKIKEVLKVLSEKGI